MLAERACWRRTCLGDPLELYGGKEVRTKSGRATESVGFLQQESVVSFPTATPMQQNVQWRFKERTRINTSWFCQEYL